eukprot:2711123-Amphidinium_carterae.1
MKDAHRHWGPGTRGGFQGMGATGTPLCPQEQAEPEQLGGEAASLVTSEPGGTENRAVVRLATPLV